MKPAAFEAQPGVWLDARRAVFLEEESTLAIADLHLGYAWAHRFNGQLMPLQPADPWLDRLNDLCTRWQPKNLVCLGDVVHQALPLPAIEQEINTLIEKFSCRCEVTFLLGNHDRGLKNLKCGPVLRLEPSLRQNGTLFLHGDAEPPQNHGADLILMGHEHPAISLGDGVTTAAKFPCFLLAPGLIILPAFSQWVAGTSFGHYPFMSSLARSARFRKAVAIMGNKLLPVPLRAEETIPGDKEGSDRARSPRDRSSCPP